MKREMPVVSAMTESSMSIFKKGTHSREYCRSIGLTFVSSTSQVRTFSSNVRIQAAVHQFIEARLHMIIVARDVM